MDIKSPEERSKNMAAIHSKNTKPEIYLRKLLFARGYRYGVNSKKCAGASGYIHEKIQYSNFCTWVFLAQARGMQICLHAKIKGRILAEKV